MIMKRNHEWDFFDEGIDYEYNDFSVLIKLM